MPILCLKEAKKNKQVFSCQDAKILKKTFPSMITGEVFLTDMDFFLVKFAGGMLRRVYRITVFKNIQSVELREATVCSFAVII